MCKDSVIVTEVPITAITTGTGCLILDDIISLLLSECDPLPVVPAVVVVVIYTRRLVCPGDMTIGQFSSSDIIIHTKGSPEQFKIAGTTAYPTGIL